MPKRALVCPYLPFRALSSGLGGSRFRRRRHPAVGQHRAPRRRAAPGLRLGEHQVVLLTTSTAPIISHLAGAGLLLGLDLGGGVSRASARAPARRARAEAGAEGSGQGTAPSPTSEAVAAPRSSCAALPAGQQLAGRLVVSRARARGAGGALRCGLSLCSC